MQLIQTIQTFTAAQLAAGGFHTLAAFFLTGASLLYVAIRGTK